MTRKLSPTLALLTAILFNGTAIAAEALDQEQSAEKVLRLYN
ncbi:hypothetical protein [Aeromonas sobria]|nr:hypothetical protein [Aeromonas sobria]